MSTFKLGELVRHNPIGTSIKTLATISLPILEDFKRYQNATVLLKKSPLINNHEVYIEYQERINALRSAIDKLVETYDHNSDITFYEALIAELPLKYNYTYHEVNDALAVATYTPL